MIFGQCSLVSKDLPVNQKVSLPLSCGSNMTHLMKGWNNFLKSWVPTAIQIYKTDGHLKGFCLDV